MAFRHSKIVCTIGPASRSPRIIERLLRAGMDVARLNFSHGSHANHAENIAVLRAGATHLQLVVDPITKGSIEMLGDVLAALDRA